MGLFRRVSRRGLVRRPARGSLSKQGYKKARRGSNRTARRVARVLALRRRVPRRLRRVRRPRR